MNEKEVDIINAELAGTISCLKCVFNNLENLSAYPGEETAKLDVESATIHVIDSLERLLDMYGDLELEGA